MGIVLAMVLAFGTGSARAQAGSSKIAADLRQVVAAATTPTLNWARDVFGVRYVKVLIVGAPGDPELAALRADVVARGGSVYMRYTSVTALSALLPASQVAAIAARNDVQGISPNRLIARTGVSMAPSAVEQVSGAAAVRTRTESNSHYYTGLDGVGVGIAVLDSGIMWKHKHFQDWQGNTRVKRAIDLSRGKL